MSMSTEKELFDRLEAWKIPRSDENKVHLVHFEGLKVLLHRTILL